MPDPVQRDLETEINEDFQRIRNEHLREIADEEGWTGAEYRAATTGDIYDQIQAEIDASFAAAERRRAEDAENEKPPLTGNTGAVVAPPPAKETPAIPPPVPITSKDTSATVPATYTPSKPIVVGKYGLRDEYGNLFDCVCALSDEHNGISGIDGELMKANMHTWLGKTCPTTHVEMPPCGCSGSTPTPTTTPTPTPTPTPDPVPDPVTPPPAPKKTICKTIVIGRDGKIYSRFGISTKETLEEVEAYAQSRVDTLSAAQPKYTWSYKIMECGIMYSDVPIGGPM